MPTWQTAFYSGLTPSEPCSTLLLRRSFFEQYKSRVNVSPVSENHAFRPFRCCPANFVLLWMFTPANRNEQYENRP